jgi:hypothetical protein
MNDQDQGGGTPHGGLPLSMKRKDSTSFTRAAEIIAARLHAKSGSTYRKEPTLANRPTKFGCEDVAGECVVAD